MPVNNNPRGLFRFPMPFPRRGTGQPGGNPRSQIGGNGPLNININIQRSNPFFGGFNPMGMFGNMASPFMNMFGSGPSLWRTNPSLWGQLTMQAAAVSDAIRQMRANMNQYFQNMFQPPMMNPMMNPGAVPPAAPARQELNLNTFTAEQVKNAVQAGRAPALNLPGITGANWQAVNDRLTAQFPLPGEGDRPAWLAGVGPLEQRRRICQFVIDTLSRIRTQAPEAQRADIQTSIDAYTRIRDNER